MVSLSMDFNNEFLKEETRCGYKIGRDMKGFWAVSIDLLEQLKRVCKKNNINYFAGYGTLLGAVRHDGYIPWDDDIDVVMMREDYDKLCYIASKAFISPYFFQTEYSDLGFSRGFARLRNSNTTAIQTYEYTIGHIHYNQGIFIDIFPMDYVPEEVGDRKIFFKNIKKYKNKSLQLSAYSCRYVPGSSKGAKEILKKILAPILCSFFEKYKIFNPYLIKYEYECKKYLKIKSSKIAVMWFYDETKDNFWEANKFGTGVSHKFEMVNINIPHAYKSILTSEYGNWRKFVIGKNAHGDLIVDIDCSYKKYLKEQPVGVKIQNEGN